MNKYSGRGSNGYVFLSLSPSPLTLVFCSCLPGGGWGWCSCDNRGAGIFAVQTTGRWMGIPFPRWRMCACSSRYWSTSILRYVGLKRRRGDDARDQQTQMATPLAYLFTYFKAFLSHSSVKECSCSGLQMSMIRQFLSSRFQTKRHITRGQGIGSGEKQTWALFLVSELL